MQEPHGTSLAQSTCEATRNLLVKEDDERDLTGRKVGGWYSGKGLWSGQDRECVRRREEKMLREKNEGSRWKRQALELCRIISVIKYSFLLRQAVPTGFPHPVMSLVSATKDSEQQRS